MWFSGGRRQPAIRSLVGEGMSIRGDLRFAGGIRIDGDVHGNVIAQAGSPSLVVISETARIQGNVRGGHVIVHGEISGAVEASELLELQAGARIHGNVRYQALEMHQGAAIHGELLPLNVPADPAPDLVPMAAG